MKKDWSLKTSGSVLKSDWLVALGALMALPLMMSCGLQAQQPGGLDPSFNPGSGANDKVHALAVQPDSKILLGGKFTQVNGTTRHRIARLNADGSLDTDFEPSSGVDNLVWSIVLQPDRKILLAGGFTNVNGTTRPSIARLNSNGSLDPSFNAGTGATDWIGDWIPPVTALALQSDGKIMIGGPFITINGIAFRGIARLNSDGTLDRTFNPGTGPNAPVLSVVVQNDNKVIVAGVFTIYNGAPHNGIVRLNTDGTLDGSFNIGTGPQSFEAVDSIALQPDGKIVIGGDFTTFNNHNFSRVARLNPDGSLDPSFLFDPGVDADVYAVAVENDGKIPWEGRSQKSTDYSVDTRAD